MQRKDILDIASLSVAEIESILDTADRMREISERSIKKVPTLRGKTVVHFFHEPSTRTKTSFDIAAKRLSADSLSLSRDTSSLVKGETLIDTARNLDAMAPDAIVIRHSSAGAPHLIARHVRCGVINAGDGCHAHPTQALLDMLTVRQHRGRLNGLRVAIIGDIAHSRVARSGCEGFVKMGSEVILCGPPTMIPAGVEAYGVSVTGDVEEALAGADVVMLLRVQKERQQAGLFPGLREYARVYGIDRRRLAKARDDVLIMHPGPVNRGVELAPEVADGPFAVILDQVANGVAVRMALLLLVAGGTRNENPD